MKMFDMKIFLVVQMCMGLDCRITLWHAYSCSNTVIFKNASKTSTYLDLWFCTKFLL